MFTKDSINADVASWGSPYGTKYYIEVRTQKALDFLHDNGFVTSLTKLNTPYDIGEPLARFIARSYLEPANDLTVYAPMLAPRSFYL